MLPQSVNEMDFNSFKKTIGRLDFGIAYRSVCSVGPNSS